MIMKLDHITYVAARADKDRILTQDGKKNWKFCETEKQNLASKQKYLSCRQTTHDLYFFEGDIPVEVIFYDEVADGTGMEVRGNVIYGKGSDLQAAKICLEKMGLPVELGEHELQCNLKGRLGRKDCFLKIGYSEQQEPAYLDRAGYGCITLLLDSVDRLYEKRDCDFEVTEPEELEINHQLLKISFVKCKGTDLIFEFIAPGRKLG